MTMNENSGSKNAGQEKGIAQNKQRKSGQSNTEIENSVEENPGAQNAGGDAGVKDIGMRKSSQTGINTSSDNPA